MSDNDNAVETAQEQEIPAQYKVVGIRFRSCGKIYTFDANDLDVVPGTRVVVDSEMGLSLGRVVTPIRIIERTREPYKKIARIATEADLETVKNNKSLEDEAKAFCVEKAKALNLPMKIVFTETTLDKKRMIFYFTADGRIDFRELVRDLASRFKTRIEMRQIGVRDEVKMIGGFGVCGRQTCCSLFLSSFAPITIRMAKQQELSINQSKLSGVCGRLMCCLGYEFRESAKEAASPATQEEAVETLSEETPDSLLQSADAAVIYDDVEQPESTDSGQDIIVTETGGQGVPSPAEKKPEDLSDKHAGEKRHFRRDRRRRHRHKTGQPSQQPPQVQKQETVQGQPEERKGPAEKDKGRPFNRRRKFWKKKKHEQK